MSARLRWGFLGASNIVRTKFIPSVQESSSTVPWAVASRNMGRAQSLASDLGIPNAYGSYEDLLADPAVDAVYVSVPNTQHADWIVAALEAGKPVLSEKPMVVDGAQAQRVFDASERTGLPVLEGFMYRFHPQNVYARKILRSGSIGEIREVRCSFSYPLIGMMDPDNIRVTDGLGAGALMDIGSYVVSAVRDSFRAEPIAAMGWTDREQTLGIDAGFSGSLQFPHQRFGTVSWSLRGGYGAGYEVLGSEGALLVPHAFMPGSSGMLENSFVIHQEPSIARRQVDFAPANHFALMIDAFAESVLDGAPLEFDARDALGNARALDLIRSSGVEVAVEPA